jgi:hypothetical protein
MVIYFLLRALASGEAFVEDEDLGGHEGYHGGRALKKF